MCGGWSRLERCCVPANWCTCSDSGAVLWPYYGCAYGGCHRQGGDEGVRGGVLRVLQGVLLISSTTFKSRTCLSIRGSTQACPSPAPDAPSRCTIYKLRKPSRCCACSINCTMLSAKDNSFRHSCQFLRFGWACAGGVTPTLNLARTVATPMRAHIGHCAVLQ